MARGQRMHIRIYTSVCLLLLTSACVARAPAPIPPGQPRFEALWQQAESLEDCLHRLDAATVPGEAAGLGREHSLLLAAALDQRERSRFRDLPPAPPDAPGMLSATLTVTDGVAHHPLLTAPVCRWLVYAGLDTPWAPASADSALRLPGAEKCATLRVVFLLAPQARPLHMMRHGEALEVTAWGLGLELQAAELRDATGRPLHYWFLRP